MSMVTTDERLDVLCHEIMEHQKKRETIVKMQNAQRSQITSFVCRCIGYSSFDDPAERKKVWSQAGKIISSIQDGEDAPVGFESVADTVKDMVETFDLTFAKLEEKRKQIEKVMSYMVESFPVYDWWVSIKGAGAYGLAAIIGEAGNLNNYDNPAKLWKRFGDAVMDGTAQGKLPKNTAAEVWIAHGYNKRRHSIAWRIVDSMWKCGGADNPYKVKAVAYKEKQLETLKQKWLADGKKEKDYGPGHAHNRAVRYMRKMLIRDLWCKWTGKEITDHPPFVTQNIGV